MNNRRVENIMPHLVAGYPDTDTSLELIKTFSSAGVPYIEVQLPFSDPLADGSVITEANRLALQGGITADKTFDMLKEAAEETDSKIVVMTYANIFVKKGMEAFIDKCSHSGVDGVIVPDLPYDERIAPPLKIFKEKEVNYIPVVSPGMKEERLKSLCNCATGAMIYTTLKRGLTGSSCEIEESGLQMIKRIKEVTNTPVAAGFGISSAEQVKAVTEHADIAVIGSHLLNLLNTKGLKGVEEFLEELNY